MRTRRGIREVPANTPVEMRPFLQDLREAITDTYNPKQGLITPTNFKVTPVAQGAILQWTRSNGDFYEVLWSDSGSITNANIVNVSDSAQWHDFVGAAAHTRWYWVRSARYHGERSIEAGAIQVTTLAAGTNVTPPKPPVGSSTLTQDPRTRNINPRGPNLA